MKVSHPIGDVVFARLVGKPVCQRPRFNSNDGFVEHRLETNETVSLESDHNGKSAKKKNDQAFSVKLSIVHPSGLDICENPFLNTPHDGEI